MKGNTLDLWMTWPDCKKFGKQHLNVYVTRGRAAQAAIGAVVGLEGATCPGCHTSTPSRARALRACSGSDDRSEFSRTNPLSCESHSTKNTATSS